MIIYPDIEIKSGQSVSMIHGIDHDPIVYDISPIEAAKQFEADGAEYLHVIDIDGILQDGQHNADMICKIIKNAKIPVQVGGGIRTHHDVNWWLDHGASRVVLGTVSVIDRQMVMDVCSHHPGQIVISIDGKDGYVMTHGWRTQTSLQVLELAKSFESSGAAAIIYTDLDRFAEKPESSLATTTEMGTELNIPVISSGTVKTLDDISLLRLLPNIDGVVTGWALFSKKLDLKEAIDVVKGPGVDPSLADEGVAPKQEELEGLPIKDVNHIGLRISNIEKSLAFYESIGFYQASDHHLDQHNPIILKHKSGVSLNLLGPSKDKQGVNILMYVDEKYSGYTHIALRVSALEKAKTRLESLGIAMTESFDNEHAKTLSIRDPDNNVIELGGYSSIYL